MGIKGQRDIKDFPEAQTISDPERENTTKLKNTGRDLELGSSQHQLQGKEMTMSETRSISIGGALLLGGGDKR